MRRSLPWLILSLLCFGLAGYFWRLGDRWAAEKKASAPQASGSNSALRTPHSALAPHPSPLTPVSVSAPAALARLTNNSPLPFRLSNTTNRVGVLVGNDHAILLENALLDTDQKVDLAIPDHLKSHGNPGAWIVQARGPIDNAFRSLLQNAGATIISYIPNNAYLVRVSDGSSFNLEPSALVQAVLPYEPYYKLKPALLAPAIKQQLLPEGTVVNLLVYNDALTQTEDALKAMGAEVLGSPERSPFGRVIHVAPPRNATPAMAQLPGVQEMELARPRRTANDLSRATLGISPDSVTSTNYLNLSGSNITVGVIDTGVDMNHPDLAGRILTDLPISGVDSNGHGTFIAGIISGNGSQSTLVSGAQGSVMPATNGQFRGKAPASIDYSISLANGSDTYLQEQLAVQTNVLIANNSWTYGSQSYDLAAANYDAAVRDALPAVPGSRQLLYVFPSGNGGGANVWDNGPDNGVGGSADSIQSPGTAKNVITVGAIEQPRNITNETVEIVGTDTNGQPFFQTNQPWLPSTDASDQVASFSGRGNVGVGVEGESGRFKPDVVAPGTMIISTRSTEWDTAAYYSPTTHIIKAFSGIVLHTNAAFFNQIFVPQNTVGLTIEVFANNDSPVPFPDMPIFVRQAGLPDLTNGPSGYDFVRTNVVTMPPDGGTPISPVGELWRYAVANASAQTVVFDLVTDLTVTNQHGNFLGELQTNLNDVIGPFYRYESGTSLAAGEASGVLALMEEFLEQRSGGLFGPTNRPSPALMKALLINGSRSVGDLYDFTVDTTINFQGWGLVNLPNSVPATLTNFNSIGSSSLLLFDQDPTNALATGQTHTRLFTLNPDAQNVDMHITLVWTDPPGNPVAGKKLVNDLDLIVTNLDTGEVFFGNDILAGNDFNLPSDTNLPPNLDVVNNVENVYLLGPLGTNYSVTVLGHRVNVNAVTAHTNQVVQDYALVIGSDASFTNGLALTNSVTLTNGTTITADVFPANPPTTPLLTTITNQFVGNTNFTGGILLNQRAGASTPLLGLNTVSATNNDTPTMGLTAGLATVGMTNQWHFYTLTNENSFTNASFLTFLPPTLSIPRIGTRASSNENSTRLEADIDMYVSTDPSLTNLNPVALNGAFKSLTREGEETVVLTNAIPGAYYIGVKSEDQEASEYDFMGIFSLLPPDTVDDEGNHHLHGFPVPQAIPDGTPAHPGGIRVLAVATSGVKVKRVVVTNTVSHQLMGDLIGTLTHKRTFAVLNNHAPDGAVTNRVYVYDDSGQGTPAGTPSAQRTDGPGSLMNFGGQTGTGQWMVTMADNALGHVGTNNDLQIFLERQQDPTDGVVTNFIQPNSCVQDFVDVPVGATNMLVLVTNFNGVGPIVVTVCAPDGGACMVTNIPALPLASIALNFDRTTIPLISPGTWTIKQCNLSQSQVAETHLFVKIGIDLNSVVPVQYQSTGPVAIADDAVTTSSLVVTNANKLFSVEVGLRVDHPRVSDLVFHLISPKGVRNLLFENRGGLTPNGMGLSVITTNIVPTSSSGGAAPDTNNIDTGISNWTATINYDMQNIPDEMVVFSGTNQLFDTGMVRGTGTLNVTNPPGGSTVLTIVMNPTTGNSGTAWDYTVTSVRAQYLYYKFTEDTNKTLTPIKFAVPPYIPTILASTNTSTNGMTLTTNDYVLPEETIDNLKGSNAKGRWQMEVWDNRVGPSGASNGLASLGSWQLSFIFENQVPAPINLLHGQPVTNTVCPGQMQFYSAAVPYWTDFASNRLISATAPGVTVWFNQTQPPSGTNGPGDILVIGPNSTGGTFVINSTSAPPLVPSATYFIGIQSTNGNSGCSPYVFDVEYDVTPLTLNVPVMVTNTPAAAITRAVTATNTGPIPKYFSYVVNSNETAVSFQVTNIQGGDVDLVVSRAPNFPDLTDYDYGSFNPGTEDEGVIIFTNSEPVVLAAGTWYLGVFNRSTNTVSYTVAVTDFTNALPNIIPLILDIPYNNTNFAAANAPDYYRYTVTTNESGVQFQLLNLSGDVNLVARKGFPPLPTLANSPYNSQNPGTNNESIIVFTNSTPVRLSAGDWFLAVLNPFGTDVSYTALVTDTTNVVQNIVTLTNAIPYFNTNNAGADNIDYYLFVVSTNAARAQFEINNPTADMALAVEKDLPLPTLTSWHYFSNNSGTNNELVTVFGSSSPVPLGPGNWFLAAINISGVPAQYSIKATEFPAAGTNLVISNPHINVTSNEFCFFWNSIAGVHYYVQARPVLPGTNWDTLATMIATDTNTFFCWPLPSQYHIFRVAEGVATNNFVQQVQIKSINRGPSGVLLTWNAVFNTSYQVLRSPSLAPPNWQAFSNIITSTNGTCTFLDNGSQSGGLGPLRYYRLRNYP